MRLSIGPGGNPRPGRPGILALTRAPFPLDRRSGRPVMGRTVELPVGLSRAVRAGIAPGRCVAARGAGHARRREGRSFIRCGLAPKGAGRRRLLVGGRRGSRALPVHGHARSPPLRGRCVEGEVCGRPDGRRTLDSRRPAEPVLTRCPVFGELTGRSGVPGDGRSGRPDAVLAHGGRRYDSSSGRADPEATALFAAGTNALNSSSAAWASSIRACA